MRLVFAALSSLLLAPAAQAFNDAADFPYEATVGSDNVIVRSGPGGRYYPPGAPVLRRPGHRPPSRPRWLVHGLSSTGQLQLDPRRRCPGRRNHRHHHCQQRGRSGRQPLRRDRPGCRARGTLQGRNRPSDRSRKDKPGETLLKIAPPGSNTAGSPAECSHRSVARNRTSPHEIPHRDREPSGLPVHNPGSRQRRKNIRLENHLRIDPDQQAGLPGPGRSR
ncbi:MAG: hypothetical protein Ct9H300mP1_01100 [Planctomycetaceae bacterium]|nr:MAG: hypothetical protein Ct9H300mP1_01100 [Planctomycetaceae bacterium]